MSDNLDISKVINTILENPALVSQISSLMQSKSEVESASLDDETSQMDEPTVSEVTPEIPKRRDERRANLLSAMKPYLSENRSRTIDTMLSISDILGSIKGR